jgi:steroid 5-alpha reductase family enzyme
MCGSERGVVRGMEKEIQYEEQMRKKVRKSTLSALALFVYVTAMAVYFLPRNTEIGQTEKYVTLGASYVIVLALWFVLKKKEAWRERRKEEYNKSKDKQK